MFTNDTTLGLQSMQPVVQLQESFILVSRQHPRILFLIYKNAICYTINELVSDINLGKTPVS